MCGGGRGMIGGKAKRKIPVKGRAKGNVTD